VTSQGVLALPANGAPAPGTLPPGPSGARRGRYLGADRPRRPGRSALEGRTHAGRGKRVAALTAVDAGHACPVSRSQSRSGRRARGESVGAGRLSRRDRCQLGDAAPVPARPGRYGLGRRSDHPRRPGPGASRGRDGCAERRRNAFNRIAWPAFGILVLTGVWNVVAEDNRGPAYQHTLMLKYTLVVASGVTVSTCTLEWRRARQWRSSARSPAHRAGHAVRRDHARRMSRRKRAVVCTGGARPSARRTAPYRAHDRGTGPVTVPRPDRLHLARIAGVGGKAPSAPGRCAP